MDDPLPIARARVEMVSVSCPYEGCDGAVRSNTGSILVSIDGFSLVTNASESATFVRAGLEQRQAIVRIAARTGGTVAVAQVARNFVDDALTRSVGRRTHGQAAYVLGASDQSGRVARGTDR